ncbi:adenylate isopentenyltransferase [Amborella trichopoda]|nr:adenylate isopentenyltransferase [Amborella trichopoda]|eukprot:XP_006842304.2 adenylate isopentenyltransferase [Amborella trichopoda]
MEAFSARSQKEPLVVIMGPTGTGKTKLSLDLATRFSAEIINCDKMQFYKGLDIATNKVSVEDRRGVRHHLLGEFDDRDGEVSADNFRSLASEVIASVTERGRIPILVGGSNSYIQALVEEVPLPASDESACIELLRQKTENDLNRLAFRYDCCFIWVDVKMPVLYEWVSRRVDEMLDAGLFEEVAKFYEPGANYSQGVRKAIGVPEFDMFLQCFPPGSGQELSMAEERKRLFDKAVSAIKSNTCELAKKQRERIVGLEESGWKLHRIDATEVFFSGCLAHSGVSSQDSALSSPVSSRVVADIWEEMVVQPTVKIVKKFLEI